MKKYLLSLIVIALGIFIVSSAMAVDPGAGIKNSAHDLSAAGLLGVDFGYTGDGTAIDRFYYEVADEKSEREYLDRICIYCHAPHHAAKAADMGGILYYPLWNHAVTTASYLTYDNGIEDPQDLSRSLNADIGQPSGVSKLCLSCHDGSVALNAYGFTPSESIGDRDFLIGGLGRERGLIGKVTGGVGDLKNHHPIGFDYATVAAQDTEIATPTTLMSYTSVVGGAATNLAGNANVTTYTIDELLWNGKMECTTCHSVHNTRNAGVKLTWIEDKNSTFCLVCHLKDGRTQ